MKKERHIRLSVGKRKIFTAIVKGRRHIYYPCTDYYLRRFCDVVGIDFVLREWDTVELTGRTGRFIFKVEDIYIKDIDGMPHFKIYLGDVVEYEKIDENRNRKK